MTFNTLLSSIRRHGKVLPVILVVSALALLSFPAFAQVPPVRQSDQAVKMLLEQLDTARDKFEGNLDDSLKSATLRNPTGEVKVSGVLQDLQDNTKKLKERFNDNYAASAEVEVVLKQATTIDAFMKRSPEVTKGRSEWDLFAATLKSVAGVYATTFPLPETAVVRRMNDKETADAAQKLADSADQFKKQIDQDKALAAPDKDSAKKSTESLVQAAETLKSRVNDSKPATAEVKSVVDQTMALDVWVRTHPSPLAAASWADVRVALTKIEQSFGLAH